MYKKVIKKYYLFKIFSLAIPLKKFCNQTYYVMCSYLITKTPFLNLKILLEEFYKIIHIFHFHSNKKYLLFFCTEKIFLVKSNFFLIKKITSINWQEIKNLYFKNWKHKNFFMCIYNVYFDNKILSLIKDLKVISLGFLNYQLPLNTIDYVFPIDCFSFANLYFFHFLLKKILINVKN